MRVYKEATTFDAVLPSPAVRDRSSPAAEDGRRRLYKTDDGFRAIMSWYDGVVASIDTPVRSCYVETRFGRTHMLVAGLEDAPPLFLIPGVAGCAPLWRRQVADFSQKFRVHALDIVGQPGRSDSNTPSFLNDDFVHWLCDVLDELGIARAHFGGVSVGGWISMRMAIDAPERVFKVVMLGPTGLSRARLPVKIWVSKVLSKRRGADALEDDLTAKSVTTPSPGASFGTFDRQLARAMALATRHYRVDRSVGVYDEDTGRVSISKGLRVLGKFFLSERKSYLRRLKAPGLLVFGQHELTLNPEKVGKKALRLMPNLELEIVPDAGHAAIYDRPEKVNRMIMDFLER